MKKIELIESWGLTNECEYHVRLKDVVEILEDDALIHYTEMDARQQKAFRTYLQERGLYERKS